MRALLALIAMTAAANAADVEFSYESFHIDHQNGRAKIILKVENKTSTSLDMVVAECAFLDKAQKAIDTATLIASNVQAGSSAYADAWSVQIGGIEHASCRISNYR